MATPDTYRSSTSSSDLTPVRRFGARVALFTAPLLLGWALFELALWRTGESWPLERVVATQLAHSGQPRPLYGRMLFSQQFNLYKYTMIKHTRPKIVVHGTSRVMQIRDVMFHPLEKMFYNAGGMIQGPEDALAYARLVASGDLPRPDVVIVGPDPWWFKRLERDSGWLDPESLRDTVGQFPAHVEAARLLLRRRVFPWAAVLQGAPAPSPGYGSLAIGAKPLFDGGGFRIDGSLQLESAVVEGSVRDPGYKDRHGILKMVTEYRDAFARPTAVDVTRVEKMIKALTLLKSLGIEVLVFLPPFARPVQTALETSPGWKDLWHAYVREFPLQLKRAQLPCLGLSEPARDGFDDRYMYDGYHAGEIYAAAIVKRIVDHSSPESFLKRVDVKRLDEFITTRHPSPIASEVPARDL